MNIRVRKHDDPITPQGLHMLTFPYDDWEGEYDDHWVAWDGKTPVGFASARLLRSGSCYLTRAGVLPCASGTGLQRRLIQTRVKWARAQGCDRVVTYTLLKNYPSLVNLLKCGFRFYRPDYLWAGKDVHYFIKEL